MQWNAFSSCIPVHVLSEMEKAYKIALNYFEREKLAHKTCAKKLKIMQKRAKKPKIAQKCKKKF